MRWMEWQAIYMYDWVEKDWLGLCEVDKEEKSFQAEWIATTRQEDVKWQDVWGTYRQMVMGGEDEKWPEMMLERNKS